MLALVTDNLEKYAECARILGRHGRSVSRWSRADFDEASLAQRFAQDSKLEAVLLETSNLYHSDSDEPVLDWRDPANALLEVRNVGTLVAWLPGPEGTVRCERYQSELRGWLDPRPVDSDTPVFAWDAVFRTRALGLSYHELRARGLKHSVRDQVLSRFVTEHLYLPERVDLAHHPQRPTQTIDWSLDVGRFVLEHPWLSRLATDRPGVGRALRSVVADGVFFRSAQSRRERNYWLPGLNAGIPLTPKRDAVHEVTFFVHDCAHFAQTDLIFTGDFGGEREVARNVYVVWRMLSEAASLVFADMLFVDELARGGLRYDFSKRRIYPLFECMNVDPVADFEGAARALVAASARYALLGDTSGFDALVRPDVDREQYRRALAEFCAKYEGYFRADYRWTVANFDEMAERGASFARWAELVGDERRARLGLTSLDEMVRTLRARDDRALDTLEGTVSLVLNEALELLLKRARDVAPVDAARARGRAFSRWVLGQCMMFVAWDFLPRSAPMARAILAAVDRAPHDESVMARVRHVMDAHIDDLCSSGLVSEDDRRTWNGVYPLFEPKYVSYDRATDHEPLSSVAQRCFATRTTVHRAAP